MVACWPIWFFLATREAPKRRGKKGGLGLGAPQVPQPLATLPFPSAMAIRAGTNENKKGQQIICQCGKSAVPYVAIAICFLLDFFSDDYLGDRAGWSCFCLQLQQSDKRPRANQVKRKSAHICVCGMGMACASVGLPFFAAQGREGAATTCRIALHNAESRQTRSKDKSAPEKNADTAVRRAGGSPIKAVPFSLRVSLFHARSAAGLGAAPAEILVPRRPRLDSRRHFHGSRHSVRGHDGAFSRGSHGPTTLWGFHLRD